MSEESLIETLKFIDAFNIDLKSYSDKFYKDMYNIIIQIAMQIKDMIMEMILFV